MSRDWQPGEVAMVECGDGKERRAICGRRFLDDGLAWVFRNGSRRDVETSNARPFVVIDPEDESAEGVSRLCDLIRNHHGPNVRVGLDWLSVQAALREFANPTPPRPAEPTGRWSVVEGRDKNRWVRDVESPTHPWRHIGPTDRRASWDGVCVYGPIATLSEGVIA